MGNDFEAFEAIARKIVMPPAEETEPALHPFIERNIHSGLPPKVKKLFDNGFYPEATFEAFKFLDKKVQRHAKIQESGYKLMISAFNEALPLISLTALTTKEEKDEQQGFKWLFVGGVLAIRNPRGQLHGLKDDPDICLDHLSFASFLLRRLEQSGFS